jgi:hypothetical protein
MSFQVFQLPKQTSIGANLTLLSSAQVYFYATGTSDLQAIYQNSTLTTPHANPVIADTAGALPAIYLDPTLVYKVTVKTSTGIELYTVDPANDQVALQALTQTQIGTIFQPRTAAEITAGVTPSNYAYPVLNVLRYGAVGDFDGTTGTDNLAAFDRAFAVAMALSNAEYGVEIYVPPGAYRFTDEWDIYRPSSPRRDITIRGCDQLNSILVADFFGAGKALVRSIDPADTSRSSPTSLRDLGFSNRTTSGGVNPVFFWILGHGESRMERIRFAGSNNTVWRDWSPQGLRGTDIVAYFGGRHFPYKATTGITFDVNTGTNTITASAPIFTDPDDVGLDIYIFGSNSDNRTRYTIATVVDSTHATYASSHRDHTETGAAGHFEAARCSMTAASTTLTANSDCFSAGMEGLYIYVQAAADGAFGDSMLYASIVSVDAPDQVTLSLAADNNVTNAHFGVACIDFGKPDGWVGSSDCKFDKIHIEHYRGIAWASQDTDNYHLNGKIHGETSPATSFISGKSDAAMWIEDFGGQIDVDLDSSCSTSDCRVYLCNTNDVVLFDSIWSRLLDNEVIFKSELLTTAEGLMVVRGLTSYDYAATPGNLLNDANYNADPTDPRILPEGYFQMLGDAEKARHYVGRDGYHLPDGRFVFGASTNGASYAQTLSGASGARMLFEDIGTRLWSIGNTPGGGTQYVIRDESMALDRLIIRGSNGAVIPGADNTQSFGELASRWTELFAATGTVNTSDAREKQQIGAIPDAWLDAWSQVEWSRYRWNEAVERKGEGARWHIGLIAQRVRDVFAASGLDAFQLGLLCYDEWSEEGGIPAGNRFGIRYEEALAMEAALMRRELKRLK